MREDGYVAGPQRAGPGVEAPREEGADEAAELLHAARLRRPLRRRPL